jgi:hypothetical protein
VLGFDDNQGPLRLGFRWDLARTHSLGLTWFSISRDSSGEFDEPCDFLDRRFMGAFESGKNIWKGEFHTLSSTMCRRARLAGRRRVVARAELRAGPPTRGRGCCAPRRSP